MLMLTACVRGRMDCCWPSVDFGELVKKIGLRVLVGELWSHSCESEVKTYLELETISFESSLISSGSEIR
jgi:hypothetical protein